MKNPDEWVLAGGTDGQSRNILCTTKTNLTALSSSSDLGPSEPDRCIRLGDHCDRPLTFHWRVDRAISHLGLPKARSRQHEEARNAIVAEAIIAAQIGQWISYSRNRNFYAGKGRYCGTAFTYDTVVPAVDELERHGLIEHEKASPGDHNRTGLQSRFRATQGLITALHGIGYHYQLREVLRLKDETGNLIDYRDTNETRRMRREVERINDGLRSARIDLAAPDVLRIGPYLIVRGAYILPTTLEVYRVFVRCSFKCCGRAIQWPQHLPKAYRCQLLLDGEPVAEPDFSGMHASILYGQRGLIITGDPYETGEFSRDEGKAAFNIGLNARTPQAAVAAIANKLDVSRSHASRLFNAMRARHAPVADAFGSDMGVRLMRIESDIMMRTLGLCMSAGIVALPIHDGMVVQARCRDKAVEVMQEAFASVLLHAGPCIIK